MHGQDALLAARDYFKTHSVVKMLGFGAKKLESVALNRNHFENFAREVLLVKNYCIEIYASKGSKNDWALQSQASPGNLTQVEDLIFANTDITNSVGILAFKIGQENQVGCCYVDTNERKFLVAQFADNDSFSNLESLIVQLSPKVCSTGIITLHSLVLGSKFCFSLIGGAYPTRRCICSGQGGVETP